MPVTTLDHVTQHSIYMFLENLQRWRLLHFPGQSVPIPNHSFGEAFPNIQLESPLMQLETIPSHPIAVMWEKGSSPHLATTSFRGNKVSPEPSLLQTKQSWLPQELLIRLVLRTPHSFVSLLWICSRVSTSFL